MRFWRWLNDQESKSPRQDARIEIACAQRGIKMADEIRTLLEKHFAD
jgi:hypothetical protein